MEDDWEIDDIPHQCRTLILELKPDVGEIKKERKLMDISSILDEGAWDAMTEKAAFGSEADRAKLDALGAKAEAEIAVSESTRMTWEESKHQDVLEWMKKKMVFFDKVKTEGDELRNTRTRLVQYASDGKTVTEADKKKAEKQKIKEISKAVEEKAKVFYDNQKEQIEAHKTARLLRLVREQKLDTASDQFVQDTFAFLRFVSVFTIIMLLNRRNNSMVFTWGKNLKNQLEPSSFKDITEVNGLWDYLEQDLGPVAASMRHYNNDLKSPFDVGVILEFNKILGGVRIRQVRGTSEPCTIGPLAPQAMTKIIPQCYTYDPKSPGMAPLTKYDALLGTTTAYNFKTDSDMGTHSTYSKMLTSDWYPGSGYEQIIPSSNISQATEYISSLRRQGWTDDLTRALFVEMNLYNPNINRFSVVNIMFEFPLHGGVLPSVQYQNVKLFKYAGIVDILALILELIMVAQLFEFIRLQVSRVRLIGYQDYFRNAWTWFDLLNSGTLWCVIQFRIQWLVMVGMLNFNMNTIIDIKSCANMIEIEDQVNSFNALLIYMRAFKFLSLWPRLQKYKDTLSISVPAIMAYWLNVSVIFFAFACTGFVAFGSKVRSFHTLGDAMVTMFIYASGQYNFEELQAADPVLGPALSILFMCLVYFCLTCMFMAINCYTYNIVIRGLHLDGKDLSSLDGPDLIKVTTEKIINYVEETFPRLKEARLEREAEERRLAKIAGNRATTDAEKEALVEKIRSLIEICGTAEAVNGLGGFEFYQVTIVGGNKFTDRLTTFEMQEITAAISKVIKDTQADAEGAGDLMTKEDAKKGEAGYDDVDAVF